MTISVEALIIFLLIMINGCLVTGQDDCFKICEKSGKKPLGKILHNS